MELDRKRLLALATCGCGDMFTEHDPGTCGNCLAGMDRTAEVERLTEENTELKALMSALLEQLGEDDRDDGNAPGHAHDVPGIWDSDNGELAGKPCAWCAMWSKAKAMGLMGPND